MRRGRGGDRLAQRAARAADRQENQSLRLTGCAPAPRAIRFPQHHPNMRDAGRPKGPTPMTSATLAPEIEVAAPAIYTGPSFAAALCGFVSTTVATTMLLVLIGTL